MNKRMLGAILCAVFCLAVPAQSAKPIRVMLLDGEQGGPYHAWQETTPYLKKMLDQAGLFQVEVVTAPPAGGDFSSFKPDYKKFRVVVSNYDVPDERWSDELKASFEQYMRDGGGLVSVHAADNAFPKWSAYNLMIGIGGWRGRDEESGPLWYFKDGTYEEACRRERARRVQQALLQLSFEHRSVLVLREVEGLTCEEVAGALGVPEGTVKSRLSRAREAMRVRLRGLVEEGGAS